MPDTYLGSLGVADDSGEAGTDTMAGGALGWVLSAGAAAVPGLGMFLAAGPLMAVLPRLTGAGDRGRRSPGRAATLPPGALANHG